MPHRTDWEAVNAGYQRSYDAGYYHACDWLKWNTGEDDDVLQTHAADLDVSYPEIAYEGMCDALADKRDANGTTK